MGLMLSLEQRYRLLMRFYPPSYRQDNEGEMLSTLVDVAAPGQIDPSLREGAALAVGGLRARSRLAVARGWGIVWADSLRLTALVLLGSVASDFALFAVSGGDLLLRLRVVPVLLALAMVATVRGASRVALFLVGAALLDGWRFLAPEWQQPDLPVTMHLQYTTMALAAAVCALTWHGLRGGVRTPWSWWAAAVAVAVPGVFLAAPPWEIAFRLGSVGRPQEGIEVTLDAWPLVLAARPDAVLAVAGAVVDGKEAFAQQLRLRAEALEGVRWLAVDDGDYDPIREMLASSRGRVGF